MRTTQVVAALLTVAANAQQASVARVPTQGSFGAELQARDQAYLDLSYVRTKKRKVLLHGTLDDETQQALKTYGTTLKSDQLAAHSHNKFSTQITTDGTDPCPQNVTRHFTVKPWFWDNAWHARGVPRCLHFVDVTRIMLWVVSFFILRPFGMLRAGFSRGRELSVNGAKVAGETGINNNVVNCPLGRGAGLRAIRRVMEERILPALSAFGPGLVIISLGFDALG